MTSNEEGTDGPMDDGASALFVVRGRVQGVGFRAWTRRLARELEVRGWVRNRRDGAVEVSAGGAPATLAHFRRRLEEGPRHARVEEVREEGAGIELPEEGFGIRY